MAGSEESMLTARGGGGGEANSCYWVCSIHSQLQVSELEFIIVASWVQKSPSYLGEFFQVTNSAYRGCLWHTSQQKETPDDLCPEPVASTHIHKIITGRVNTASE